MCSLRDHLPELQKKGTVVFGISVQDVKSKRAFADKNQLNFPILADTEKKTAQAYGVLGKSGYADRVTFIVGPDGKVKNIDRAMRFDRGPSGLQSSHASALLLALSEKWKAELNKPIPSFTLKNYEGTSVTSTDTKSKLTVILFLSTQCPVSQAYNERLVKMVQTYSEKGVRFLGVNSNKNENVAQIAAYAKANNLSFAVLKDTRNTVADRFHAQHTPEVWVLDRRSMARYHGAIDDNQDEAQVKSHSLAEALDALLTDKEPPQTETKAFGCAIKRR